jgi:hypothetical protein
VRDLNADGFDDFAVMNSHSSTISVFWSQGTAGTFSITTVPVLGSDAFSIVSNDFNGDGKLDLAVALYGDAVGVLLATASGGFSSPFIFPAGHDPYQIASADFNSDGKPDLATADLYNGITVLINCTAVDVKENKSMDDQIRLYPNPSADFITVQSSSELKTIRIYDFLGQEVITLTNNIQLVKIDVSQLPKGVYEVRSGDKIQRFIKE